MMFKNDIITKILSVALLLLYLLTSSGISIWHHHCNKSNSYQSSFYLPSFSCHEHETDCGHHNNRCCQVTEGFSKQDCCSTSVELIKLELPQLLSKKGFADLHPISIIVFYTTNFSFSPIETQSEIYPDSEKSPPKILSGKGIILQNMQLRIAPPIA